MGYSRVPDGAVPCYFAQETTSNNGCGQAAVASIVDFYHAGPYAGRPDIVSAIYAHNPPDTPGAAFGSTPGHVENICQAVGLQHWRTYGPGNAETALKEQALDKGLLMIVLLDLGKLGDSWWTFHYPVAYGYDENGVHLTNMVASSFGGNGEQVVPWSTFMDAWHCWTLPSGDWQYAGICAY